ncbi:DotA/TraY family protein [Burkholderia vietnamiensis]|uniref:DotA/TraY family protein n=1 Tax=Burkholderia vietnamiensis TaxID=60552 RepID=UPI001593AE78|nr:DotA/TraY family protein [Burkholderia vietnamiensis]
MRRLFKTLAGPLALFALLFSRTANAAGLFTVPSTDWTMQYILVPLFGQGLSFANSPLAGMMTIFNSAVLFVGGILAAYAIIAGTMSTAHDGEMLGAKWSSMWVPVRLSLGVTLILPTLNGFCVAQSIILWLATQGVGLADALWTNYLQNFQQQAVYHNVALDAKLRPVFESMLLSNVCFESIVASYNGTPADQQGATQYLAGTSDVVGSVGPTWFDNGATAFGGGSVGYNYGQTDSDGPDTSACGKVTIKRATTSTSNSQTAAPLTAQNLVNMPAVTSQIEQAHIAGLKAMQAAANAAALQFFSISNGNGVTPSAATINAAINAGVAAYSSAVSAVAQQAFNTAVNQQMVTAMSEDGWASAPASYMRIMQATSQVNAAVGSLPVSVDGTSAGTTRFLHLADQRVDDDVNRAKAVLADADRVNDGTVTEGSTDGFSKIVNIMSGHSWSGPGSFDPKEDPIMTASNLGEGMVETAGFFGAGAAGLVGATAWIPRVGEVTKAEASLFGGFFTDCMRALLIPGAALAYGEPMIPFITGTAVLISWVIMLLEAMVAAPLAAVMLLNPHQEAFGGLEKAMSLTLSVTLRPAFVIFGLVSSIIVMSPIGYFVNSFFGWAFSTTPGGMLALVKMLAGAVIYALLLLYVTKQVFSFMTKLPDTILDWIGSGGHGAVMGQASDSAKQGTSGAAAAAVGAAVGIAASSGRGMGDVRKALQNRGKEREREATDLARSMERGDKIKVKPQPQKPGENGGDNSLSSARSRAREQQDGTTARPNALATDKGTADQGAKSATPNPENGKADGKTGGAGVAKPEAGSSRDMLADTAQAEQTGTLKDAKKAGSGEVSKEDRGTV